MDKILSDIKRLRNSGQFDEAAVMQFDSWEKTAMQAIAQSSLMETDAVVLLVEYANTKIDFVDSELHKKSNVLPDYQRDLLLIEQEIWRYLVGVFTGNMPQIAFIEKTIKENIAEIGRQSLH